MLYDEIEEYLQQGLYPLHMPGHKRNTASHLPLSLTHDLTEVEGVDDLHCPEGILKRAMESAANLFGSSKTVFLVGGSTCGILAAMAACTKRGDKVLCARNCHRSVYNGLAVLGLRAEYLVPDTVSSAFEIYGSITVQQVEKALSQGGFSAVVLTSPTYEGVISDIRGIKRICEKYRIPLIVDEAHGAHLGHFEGFGGGAVKAGADIVIQSTHKTLAALTQTALLHINGDMVCEDRVMQALSIFETSSPSYILMESIDGAVQELIRNGEEKFEQYRQRLDNFSTAVQGLKNIDVLFYGGDRDNKRNEIFSFDRSKLVISAVRKGYSGAELEKILREKYKLQVEMSAIGYVIAMTSYCDTDEGFDMLKTALQEIDAGQCGDFVLKSAAMPKRFLKKMEIFEALQCDCEAVELYSSAGRISGEYVFAYPPGVPILAPGEEISEEVVEVIMGLSDAGVSIKTDFGSAKGELKVVKSPLFYEKNTSKT